ncbi:MAG TPA: nucleoside-diphosphate kinase [Candidatus Marinimicrobia bacterium]|jgi:nucleoside-diphosphate kinase|nr:nucleoside-diphosphate kinase [Candidatus Neomarinimicrobiota bacterium]HOV23760.1 nucleoside-diphosphate kinase [Candidatus Neomarinimicrobiota bacterium]HPB00060.1 nucleoside-diphosphate kinase [Candidatus Neomarinimicrobiota bacterium]HQE95765.1 nucleoside-diphosphate kinase [Candidatus Neomarinimicrobiota bacterium]HQH56302.1 nucleoside-diphosphate kinase [Candidatus Neomarinimicrobiota bacterium]
MSMTLAILKPDCVKRKLIGEVISFIEKEGFRIVCLRMIHLQPQEAAEFYSIHRGKDYFEGLMNFMTSGPSVLMVLERENAVEHFRKVIGATDPKKAAEGTLRRKYAENVRYNVVHGSDSEENAKKEIAFFFSTMEIIK